MRGAYLIDFEDFGMEAAWRIEVPDFPAFLMIDDKGNEFFDKLTPSAQAVRFIEQGPKAR
ncbi:fumarate hydratase C-terminal domain-containing protein [Polaromonas sp. JS666]|uniref:fumarate hydratase C-terminal domain-containing protein n=1 Tax=Polaromonas sp. (strain JS666 / ATCC BAA-500) TaxID=296591 RepID=UPI00031BB7D5|nr:fumarate hydratase C-terminal domain-containing protein [Polaromonas sp. JS666]